MTPDVIPGLSQSLPLFSNTSRESSPVETKAAAPERTPTVVTREDKTVAVDTISISDQSRRAVTDAQKQAAAADEAQKKKDPPEVLLSNKVKSDAAVAKVEFTYDAKGEKVVKYMDTTDRLVYQLPSELTLQLRESTPKSDSVVSTQA